jgi:choline dehydrogenase-like flavoprotein
VTSRHTVIVGAGTAGAALAARLSEDPDHRVTVLEAGPTPRSAREFPPGLLDAATVEGAMPGHPANWSYLGHLTPDLPYTIARGRIIGGSSTINGGYFMRARPEDFARWSAVAGPDWAYERVLPVLRDLERDLDLGAGPFHGDAGPVPVRRAAQTNPVAQVFTAAARELGFPDEPDKNAPGPPGVGPVPQNVVDGRRINTGLAYLDPARDRPNLEVVGDCRVLRVVFDGTRAIGVEVEVAADEAAAPDDASNANVRGGGDTSSTDASGRGGSATRAGGTSAGGTSAGGTSAERGRRRVIEADEVVLCAGGIGTPHLLLVSGIGPAEQLGSVGVPVVHDAQGVGRAFTDHPDLAVGWRASQDVVDPLAAETFTTALNFSADPVGSTRAAGEHAQAAGAAAGKTAGEAAGAAAGQTAGETAGEAAGAAAGEAAAEAASEAAAEAGGDLEILAAVTTMGRMLTGSSSTVLGGAKSAARHPLATLRALKGASLRRVRDQLAHGRDLVLLVGLQHEAARGSITLESADPAVYPRIDYHYLSNADDRARLRTGVRTAVSLLRSRAFAGLFERLTELDDATLDDDAALDAWMLAHLGTAIHLCGSAPMGDAADPNAVTDGFGRVHGLNGLRIADTSILPDAPSRGPAATAVLIGELVARFIRRGD